MVIAAGGAIGAAGVVTLVTAAVRETPPPSGAEARRVAGATAVDMGVGAAGYGVGLVVAHGTGGIEDAEAEAGAFIGIGAASILTGSALILSAEDANTRRARRTSFRSHPRLGAGIALTMLGAAGVGASAAFMAAADSCSGDFCGYAAIIEVATMVPGVAALGVGIPLWVTGSRVSKSPDLQWTGDRLTASWRFR